MMSSKIKHCFCQKIIFMSLRKVCIFLAKTFPNFLQVIIFYLDIILVCARITQTRLSKIQKSTIFKHSGVKSLELSYCTSFVILKLCVLTTLTWVVYLDLYIFVLVEFCFHVKILIVLILIGVIHKLREQDFRGFLHPRPPLWTGMNFLNTPSKSYVNIQDPPFPLSCVLNYFNVL